MTQTGQVKLCMYYAYFNNSPQGPNGEIGIEGRRRGYRVVGHCNDVNSELFLPSQLNGPWCFLSPDSSLGFLEDSHRSVAILPSALVVEHLFARCQLGVSRFSGCCNLNVALLDSALADQELAQIPQSPELGDLLWTY